jgi:peptidoglycan hydrolase-like protein with peptidoglycan-binding domain
MNILQLNSVSRFVFIVVFGSINLLSVAQTENPIIPAIKKEVDKNLIELKSDGLLPPFFISYAVVDQHQIKITSSFGAVTEANETRDLWGMPFVLVGSFQLNNMRMDTERTSSSAITLDNDLSGIGVSIRKDLDVKYQSAVKAYQKKMGILSRTQLTPEEQARPDYNKTPVVNLILPPEKQNMDIKYWETYARTASAVANKYPEIVKTNVSVEIINGMIYYYDTEGSQFAVPSIDCRIDFTAQTTTADGEELWEYISIARSSTDRLPDMESFATECEEKIVHLLQLKNAPLVDYNYVGPVLCEREGLVKLIFFTFFNNRMMVYNRFLDTTSKLTIVTFEPVMGEDFISNQLTFKSLSGTKMYGGQVLDGYFPIDGEAVIPAEELVLIENGVLKNMLTSRVPGVKNQHSSGHSRITFNAHFSRPGKDTRPGVIQVTGRNMYPDADMKQELIKAARNAGLEYAYIIKDMSRSNEGTRIYVADGREELVRGIVLSSKNFNNKSFGKILGISDEEYFSTSGYKGAMTTYITPRSMIFEELELSISNKQ